MFWCCLDFPSVTTYYLLFLFSLYYYYYYFFTKAISFLGLHALNFEQRLTHTTQDTNTPHLTFDTAPQLAIPIPTTMSLLIIL